ncbi:MAG TPA: hypothetical protein VEU72_09355 [Nitrosopumilaceae archaeon]|nr:hypothetical protein [Nitrosopumilaceae archaeon]
MTSVIETQQRKKQSWYIRNPDVLKAVRYFVSFNFSEKESLEELSKRGYDMTDRTFRRIKSKLGLNKQRLDHIIKQKFLSNTVITLDTLETILERLFEMRKNCKNPSEELKIISEIKKTIKDINDLHDSGPVIASLLDLEKKENGNEKEPT